MPSRRLLPQRARLQLLFVYVLLLLALTRVATGQWVPATDHEGLWFYAGAFAFLTGALIEAPTHVVPKQAFLFNALALIATLSFGFATRNDLSSAAIGLLIVVSALLSVGLTSAAIAILWKDLSQETIKGRLARTGYVLGQFLGRPAVVTAGPFIFSIVGYHLERPNEALSLVLGWSLLVFGRPLETILVLSESLHSLWAANPPSAYLGEIIGHAVPGIVTIRHRGPAHVIAGTPILVRGDDGSPNVALALSYVGYAEGLWLRALQLSLPPGARGMISTSNLPENSCAILRDPMLLRTLEAESSETMGRRDKLIGLVAKSSDTRILRFELLRDDIELKEGRLVEAQIGKDQVLFQVLNGLTQEDVLQQKNTRGFVMGEARKVGKWSTVRKRFEHVHWVPAPNTPVFLAKTSQELPADSVGIFPDTTYPVFVNPHEAVTHNTAILGILGVGKTYLGLELVERMLHAGIRVVCLDLTDQYAQELASYHNPATQALLKKRLQIVGQRGRTAFEQNVEEGGSINQFEAAVKALAKKFLDPQQKNRLCIVNPNDFEVWRQDSKMYKDKASMASLSAAEITRIVSEAALEACQELGMTADARCCLVYEEAHSLVPEWNAVASDGDKAASNGTARAILQGRKFGLGCVVVTQRTASVTKTILNQCNTVFAMRTFDATGMEFLSNYIGSDYTSVLSTLADRHGVVFGKASSCADPVLVRFNDRDEFLSRARLELDS